MPNQYRNRDLKGVPLSDLETVRRGLREPWQIHEQDDIVYYIHQRYIECCNDEEYGLNLFEDLFVVAEAVCQTSWKQGKNWRGVEVWEGKELGLFYVYIDQDGVRRHAGETYWGQDFKPTPVLEMQPGATVPSPGQGRR